MVYIRVVNGFPNGDSLKENHSRICNNCKERKTQETEIEPIIKKFNKEICQYCSTSWYKELSCSYEK